MTKTSFKIEDTLLTAKIKGLENDISTIVESIRMLSEAKQDLTGLLQYYYDEREALHDKYYNQKGEKHGA